jgi:hypothetical protein
MMSTRDRVDKPKLAEGTLPEFWKKREAISTQYSAAAFRCRDVSVVRVIHILHFASQVRVRIANR